MTWLSAVASPRCTVAPVVVCFAFFGVQLDHRHPGVAVVVHDVDAWWNVGICSLASRKMEVLVKDVLLRLVEDVFYCG